MVLKTHPSVFHKFSFPLVAILLTAYTFTSQRLAAQAPGNPAQNRTKFFAAVDVLETAKDRA
jgi:hypothetical protein